MDVRIDPLWKQQLEEEFKKPYFAELIDFVKNEYQSKTVYPHPKNIFAAFDECPFDQVKVVILGQDPYHGPGQAHGLCFSVQHDVRNPPSLQNIFKEIESDVGIPRSASGDLTSWTKQGVFLLNATLTVVAGQAGSHQHKGWEAFTDSIIQLLSDQKENLVFLLWGRYAQNKKVLIDGNKHLILEAAHPSPLSAHSGFFGCKHFSKTNEYLKKTGQQEVDWRI